jgi:beta-aspartyl-peptidase (threonine type)
MNSQLGQRNTATDRFVQSAAAAWVLVIHGGAPRVAIAYSVEERFRRHLAIAEALRIGGEVLASGGRSLDVVQAAVRVLEDAPEFNAGCGAALTCEGHAELDASIMDGANRRVGAVAAVRRIKNPVDLARAVMERSAHVFLVGTGAEQFAVEQGIPLIDPGYFITERQVRQRLGVIESASSGGTSAHEMGGTVGAVALDIRGSLAAATSTGGIPNKRFGRVGDSPVIGAGTYAENDVCAVSATGWGEYFIRNAVAYDMCARIKYLNESLDSAASHVIEQVSRMGGYGGLIAVDRYGRIAMPYSTPTMAHGYMVEGGPAVVLVGNP